MGSLVIGIDPGASGAIAFFDPEAGTLAVEDMPVVEIMRGGKTKREVSPHLVAFLFETRARVEKIGGVVLEKVGAMPGQGTSSMFAFGRSVGMIEGVVAGLQLPLTHVTPQAWQKAAGVRDGKDGSRARAVELFPAYASLFARKKDDGRADAALIAWWGATR